ncbi:MAG: LamG domain-containing protein [Patescibacteria group bacterium]|nr:LamG domain-containing protein [Patescibacteria group bacterium]
MAFGSYKNLKSLLSLAPSQAGGLSIINNGLVGYWKLDEGVAGTSYDSSGQGNNGTDTGTTPSTSVPSAIKFYDPYSRSFNGTSDYVDIPKAASIRPMTITLSLWAKSSEATFGNYRGFIVQRSSDNNSGFIFDGNSGGTQVDCIIGNGTTNVHTAYIVPDITIWHLYTITYDGTIVRLYVDGTQQATSAISGGIAWNGTVQNLKIGRDPSWTYFNGLIDDARIYNRALSATEIATIAAGNG